MHLEIKVALNFIISYLYNKLPRRRADLFREELERLLKQKYEGHWYPEKPLKGSGYRCVHIGQKVDPIVELAAQRSGLDIEEVRSNVPEELSIWIDPFDVSYQIGEKGAVKVLYLDDHENAELDKEIKSSFNPEAQVFVPIGSQGNSLSNSPSPSFGQSPSPTFIPRSSQPITFTTAAFAATKFGSTKMKKGGHRMARSPTSNLLKHKGLSLSLHSLNIGGTQLPPSQLSPSAKEFVYGGGGGSSPSGLFYDSENQNSSGPAQFSAGFDVGQVFSGSSTGSSNPAATANSNSSSNNNALFMEKTPFMEGLSYNLNTIQYPNQPFQPVVLAN
ncbi:protein Tob2 [Latimeria chalumnae]|uniref:Transducer of ERBB2, 2 n=1 Tax=Latimeria chalumnae TaxID=7897 RepID=H3AWS0_LATCH|nr:PREDICTED: protein Tob2 [Latimeria chalumnae]|eukprot:XP_006002019.1 PREDICTED: protein Tob2 [Latimeria chalumnae]